MKYQSELIKDIIENNGHHVTTNPHYEVDCINEIINDVRGSYPKLCDYMGEWMNYANEHMNIGKFPIERVTGVTNARFENVVPYDYKSAILTGQTLVNIFKNKVTHRDTGKFIYVEDGDKIQATFKDDVTHGWLGFSFKENVPFEIGKTYTVMNELYKCDDQLNTFNVSLGNKTFTNAKPVIGINKLKIIIPSDYTEGINWMYYSVNNTNNSATIFSSNLLILEGDYTQEDIPYFEGMQSVKMPVLKVTGKNLYSGKNDFIKVNKGKEYNFYSNVTENATRLRFELFDKDKNLINDENSFVMRRVGLYGDVVLKGTTGVWAFGSDKKQVALKGTINAEYIKIREDSSEYDNLMIYESTEQIAPATYESFKSNILTVNEDVTLRGIGDVRDTLDLLTGEVVSNFETLIIDGTENWYVSSNETDLTIRYRCNNIGTSILNENMFVCDKYVVGGNTAGDELTVAFGGTTVTYRVLKSELPTLKDFKEWLNNNHHTFIYQVEKSIKTVDLTCLDENNTPTKFKPYEGVMNVVTSSETLPPLLDMEVPVEAINQNIASFI